MELRYLTLLLLLTPTLAFDNDFSFYPQNAQSCLYDAAKTSKCGGDTAAENNKCLCTNGGNFVTNTAKCLGAEDPGDVQSVYSLMLTACNESDTPLTVSKSDFQKAAKEGGESATTTSGGPTNTATSTSKPTETGDEDGGLSTGAMAGIGVGAAVIGASAIIGTAFFCIRRRRRRNSEEAHPMLPSHNSSSFQPMDPSPELGQYSAEVKPAWSTPAWNLNAPEESAKPAVASGYVAPGRVFEIDGSEREGAVEMMGSVPERYQGGSYQSHSYQGWPR